MVAFWPYVSTNELVSVVTGSLCHSVLSSRQDQKSSQEDQHSFTETLLGGNADDIDSAAVAILAEETAVCVGEVASVMPESLRDVEEATSPSPDATASPTA